MDTIDDASAVTESAVIKRAAYKARTVDATAKRAQVVYPLK